MNMATHFPVSVINWVELSLRFVAHWVCVLVAWSALTVNVWAQPRVVSPTGWKPVSDSYFGLHVRWGATSPIWPAVRFHAWRIITPETEWRGLQPKKDVWQFSALDRAVARAEEHGVEVMLTLGQTPTWAAARPFEKVPNGWGASSEPENMSDWENYIRTVVTRYKGRIKYYELWNEPRFREVDPKRAVAGFTGTARQMVEMGAIVKRVLNEVDPGAKLVSPAVDARMLGLKRLEAWLEAGGGSVSDVIAYHIYAINPEDIPNVVNAIRLVLNKYSLGHLELWNTESGFLIETPDKMVKPFGEDVFARVYTQEQGAAYMARSLILGAASGLNRFYWYAWDIPGMALSTGKGRQISYVGKAYRTTESWLRGSSITGCYSDDNSLWVCELRRDARQAWLVWNVHGQRNWKPPASWNAKHLETLWGDRLDIALGEDVEIGETPLLLLTSSDAWGVP